MKKLSILFLGLALSMSVMANCDGKCKDKTKCADCKKEAKAKHKCNKECMKDGKCAEMKKDTKTKEN
jgi:hypothetical protein